MAIELVLNGQVSLESRKTKRCTSHRDSQVPVTHMPQGLTGRRDSQVTGTHRSQGLTGPRNSQVTATHRSQGLKGSRDSQVTETHMPMFSFTIVVRTYCTFENNFGLKDQFTK